MDSQTFGSVMCGLGLFRERHKAPTAKPAPRADDDDDDEDASDAERDALDCIDAGHDDAAAHAPAHADDADGELDDGAGG